MPAKVHFALLVLSACTTVEGSTCTAKSDAIACTTKGAEPIPVGTGTALLQKVTYGEKKVYKSKNSSSSFRFGNEPHSSPPLHETSTPMPTAQQVSTPAPGTQQTCADQKDNMACGQCIQGCTKPECFTCGARISWLQSNQGKSQEEAEKEVSLEFPEVCGCRFPHDWLLSNEGYTRVWEDEFDGNNVPSGWHVDHEAFVKNNEVQFYVGGDKQICKVGGSTFEFVIKKEQLGDRPYKSCHVRSNKAWLYGKFTVRAKITKVKGTWPAIWLLPTNDAGALGPGKYGDWPDSGEIDIMEYSASVLGENKVIGTVHTGTYNHVKGTAVGGSIELDVEGWHEYTMEWRENIIIFAVDGKTYQVFEKRSDTDKGKWPFDQHFYLILNVAVGGDLGGWIDESRINADGIVGMEVDWVRVDQRSPQEQVDAVHKNNIR